MKRRIVAAIMLCAAFLLSSCAPAKVEVDAPVPPVSPAPFYDGDISAKISVSDTSEFMSLLSADFGEGENSLSFSIDADEGLILIDKNNGEIAGEYSRDGGDSLVAEYFGDPVISAALSHFGKRTPPISVDAEKIKKRSEGMSYEQSEDFVSGMKTTVISVSEADFSNMLKTASSNGTLAAGEIRFFGALAGYTGADSDGLMAAVEKAGGVSFTMKITTNGQYLILSDVTASSVFGMFSLVYDGQSGDIEVSFEDKELGMLGSYKEENTDGKKTVTLVKNRTEKDGDSVYTSESAVEYVREDGKVSLSITARSSDVYRKHVYKYDKNSSTYTYLYRARNDKTDPERKLDLTLCLGGEVISGTASVSGVDSELVFERDGDVFVLTKVVRGELELDALEAGVLVFFEA